MNATKHGLLSRVGSLPTGEQDELRLLLEGLEDAWRPANVQEALLVQELAVATIGKWRTFRAECEVVGTPVTDHDGADATLAAAFTRNAVPLHLVLRYAAHVDRKAARALASLRALQADRRDREKNFDADDEALEDPGPLNPVDEPEVTTPATEMTVQVKHERSLFEALEIPERTIHVNVAEVVAVATLSGAQLEDSDCSVAGTSAPARDALDLQPPEPECSEDDSEGHTHSSGTPGVADQAPEGRPWTVSRNHFGKRFHPPRQNPAREA